VDELATEFGPNGRDVNTLVGIRGGILCVAQRYSTGLLLYADVWTDRWARLEGARACESSRNIFGSDLSFAAGRTRG
jgi:hypothetical protein